MIALYIIGAGLLYASITKGNTPGGRLDQKCTIVALILAELWRYFLP